MPWGRRQQQQQRQCDCPAPTGMSQTEHGAQPPSLVFPLPDHTRQTPWSPGGTRADHRGGCPGGAVRGGSIPTLCQQAGMNEPNSSGNAYGRISTLPVSHLHMSFIKATKQLVHLNWSLFQFLPFSFSMGIFLAFTSVTSLYFMGVCRLTNQWKLWSQISETV